jgi:hypothetical protein
VLLTGHYTLCAAKRHSECNGDFSPVDQKNAFSLHNHDMRLDTRGEVIAMLILKRLIVWLLESFSEACLLGGLLGALLFPDFISVLRGVWPLSLTVGILLFMHGYYLTTALFGMAWRSQRSWAYPAIAATLFVIHMHIAFVRLKPDMTRGGRAMELPFQVGGACIVFACTFVDGRLLRNWVRGSSGS